MAFSRSSFLSRSPLFLFLLHCIGPVWAPLAFRRAFLPPSPAMLSRSLVFSTLLCSPTSLIPKPAMFGSTHPPTIGRREKACGPKLVAANTVPCFAQFNFFWWIGTLFLSHRFLLTGLIPARGMGWLWVPPHGIFFAFGPLGLFGMCVISESHGGCVGVWRQCVRNLYE